MRYADEINLSSLMPAYLVFVVVTLYLTDKGHVALFADA